MSLTGTCQLCQKQRPLQDSHLLPASLYEIVRKHSGSRSSSVIAIQDGIAVQTSQQMTARLLCTDCEQVLNRSGENWVLRNCYRGNGAFQLADLLRNEFTQGRPLSDNMYKLGPTTAVKLEHLVHFGVGVFWRAAAERWTLLRSGSPFRLSLGPYRERFRRFLLGKQPFPQGLYLYVLLNKDITDDSMALYPPQELERGGTYRHYQFLIPGLFFQIVLGSKVPYELKFISTQPGGHIHVTPGLEWKQAMHRLVVDSKSKGRLRQRRQ